MKKIVVSAIVILAFIGYVFRNKFGGGLDDGHVAPLNSANTSTGSNVTPSNTVYKDGSYTGSTEDAFYGNIQVKVTIASGKIADVNFLQYPNDRSQSIQINTQAMPMLKQEAIQANSASVDGVSGATDSSRAFVLSLQNALSQAS